MQLAYPIFLFFIKAATLHISPFCSYMKQEVSTEIEIGLQIKKYG